MNCQVSDAIACMKNYEEGVRYLKFTLADFAHHGEAFKAALSQNLARREISLLERRKWPFARQTAHFWFNKFNLSLIAFLRTVVLVILVFAAIYYVTTNSPDPNAPRVISYVVKDGQTIETPARGWTHVYFSIVTLTTLGYGDFRPIGWLRVVAAIEVVLGYMLLEFFIYTLAHLSEIHPYSPADWMKYYKEKLDGTRSFY